MIYLLLLTIYLTKQLVFLSLNLNPRRIRETKEVKRDRMKMALTIK